MHTSHMHKVTQDTHQQYHILSCDHLTLSADLMGVATFLAERRDRPELGGVGGVDWREVLADAGSAILC